MIWNTAIRQGHRWLSIIFTATVLANFVAIARGEPPAWIVYSPLLPLFLLMFSGLYPVSYTHLDVYKRQGPACATAGRRGGKAVLPPLAAGLERTGWIRPGPPYESIRQTLLSGSQATLLVGFPQVTPQPRPTSRCKDVFTSRESDSCFPALCCKLWHESCEPASI